MEPTPALAKKPEDVRILILGDVNLDTVIVPLPPTAKRPDRMTWEAERNCWRHRRWGGTWLMREIVSEAVNFGEKHGLATPETYPPRDRDDNSDLRLRLDQSYVNASVILRLFPKASKSRADDNKQVYRVDTYLGWVHNEQQPFVPEQHQRYKSAVEDCLRPYTQAKNQRDILVLHDKNSYFRRLDAATLATALRQQVGDETWIVWQMYSPLAEGNLWTAFTDSKAPGTDEKAPGKGDWLDRTVAVVKAECLRQAGANLPENSSLEQESQNFLAALQEVTDLRRLAKVRHLVVHFRGQGVLHYDRKEGLTTSCYYCPNISATCPDEYGTMFGFTSVLTAAVVRGLTWSICKKRDIRQGIIDGIKQGVVLDHLYYLNGYASKDFLEKGPKDQVPNPYKRLFETLSAAASEESKWKYEEMDFHLAALPLPPEPRTTLAKWSRIEGFIERQGIPAEEVARKVVCLGLKKVTDDEGAPAGAAGAAKQAAPEDKGETPQTPPHTVLCPFEEHGKIKTAYRDEIDSFASIRRIMDKYLHTEEWKHPLSIAVFGPPGSGKSFTIRQILENVNADIAKRPLEYNLAQFSAVKDLETAFHQAQDRALGEEVPLIVFDEFDTNFGRNKLGWLKYFLAPMQDGKFKAGESMYRIGRSIFVFAGGIAETWEDFYDKQKDEKYFKDAKGPDFVSRLRGHLNIAGINMPKEAANTAPRRQQDPWPGVVYSNVPKDAANAEAAGAKTEVSSVLMFRRAVLLRSLLEDNLKDIFDKNTNEAQIDDGVMRAFLKVKHFKHGARSMQAIIEMARVSPRGRFLKSSLPAPEQLAMHVNAEEFMALVNITDAAE